MTAPTILDRRLCDTCGHEFRREASAVDGRVLWFHYGTEAVGPKGDAALCRCFDCQRWTPPAPRFGSVGGDPQIMAAALASVAPAAPPCACTIGADCTRPACDDGYCDECRQHAPGTVEVFA